MKVKFGIIACLFFIGLDTSLQAQTITLDSCYAWAENNYPLIRQYALIEKARAYNLSNANKAYLPQLSLTAIAGYVYSGGQGDSKLIGMAQLNQTIWDGGAISAQKQVIKSSAASEKANLDVALYDVRSSVNQIFFGILLIDAQLQLVELHDKILSNNADRVKKLNENGMAFQTDLDEISVEQRKIKQQRIEYRYVREGYIEMLSLLIGKRLNQDVNLEKPVVGELSSLNMSRPELKAFDAQRAAINAEDAKRKVDLMPRIGLMGLGAFLEPGITLGPSSLSSLTVLGFNASWKISGLYKHANQKKLSQLALQKVDVQQTNFLFNKDLQTTQTRANIQKQQALLTEDGEIINLRNRIREGYQVKYDNGISSLIDLLNAAEKERESRIQMALHEMQLLMTYFEYKTQTGN